MFDAFIPDSSIAPNCWRSNWKMVFLCVLDQCLLWVSSWKTAQADLPSRQRRGRWLRSWAVTSTSNAKGLFLEQGLCSRWSRAALRSRMLFSWAPLYRGKCGGLFNGRTPKRAMTASTCWLLKGEPLSLLRNKGAPCFRNRLCRWTAIWLPSSRLLTSGWKR